MIYPTCGFYSVIVNLLSIKRDAPYLEDTKAPETIREAEAGSGAGDAIDTRS